ncbi:unnamed protein product [Cylicocyclus nassatus]|uniref:Uncharacterized protein n=1 Tax=Cylicocyclus nassatus TaxID=53992 RepID=A0AA36H1C3_CYLNA|nr:unnamed protein product [Cylicocyclus nassatus]
MSLRSLFCLVIITGVFLAHIGAELPLGQDSPADDEDRESPRPKSDGITMTKMTEADTKKRKKEIQDYQRKAGILEKYGGEGIPKHVVMLPKTKTVAKPKNGEEPKNQSMKADKEPEPPIPVPVSSGFRLPQFRSQEAKKK